MPTFKDHFKNLLCMKFLITTFLIPLTLSAFSQTYWADKTALLDFLYKSKEPVSYISNWGSINNFVRVNNDGKLLAQQLIRDKNNLYMIVEGTGQVYKAFDTTKGKIGFVRLDSTIHLGANYRSINFSYHDTLFSFGGYGFWKTNGLLRYFGLANEWNLIILNQEIKIINDLYFYNPDKGLIYGLVTSIRDETKEAKNAPFKEEFLVTRLNLNTREIKVIGKLTPELIKHFHRLTEVKINATKFNGVMTVVAEDYWLLNFDQNRVYKLKSEKSTEINKISAFRKNSIFEQNGTIYYSFNDNTSLDSTKLEWSDFKPESFPVYIPIKEKLEFKSYLFIASGIILAILISLLILFNRNKKLNQYSTSKHQEDNNHLSSFSKNELHLSEIEKQIIELIISKTLQNDSASVDDLNKCLGISKKSIEVQKRTRTEVLNRLNHKYRTLYQQEDDLISRIRSEEDKRYFRYIIPKEKVQIYRNNLKQRITQSG